MVESKVDLICTEKKGRCLISNQIISQGDILFVWKPYILVPYVTETDYVCANCIHVSKKQLHEKKMVRCRLDCRHVCYCSDGCEQQHWDQFHQYECSFLDNLVALQDFGFSADVINYGRLVMRILTQRLQELLKNSHGMSIEDIWIGSSHFYKFTSEKKSEFQTVTKVLTEYVLTRLIPHLAKDNQEFIGFVRSFLPDSQAVEELEMNDSDPWLMEMIHSCSFSKDAAIIEAIKCLLNRVYLLVCIEEINALFHITFALEGHAQPPQTYAMGMYPSAAFVNHSCSPNLARFPVQENDDNFRVGDVVFFATRPLQKGEEVCYSYLEREYSLYTKAQVDTDEIIKSQANRKKRLREEFFFDCDCMRCYNESRGILDPSYMNLVKELKCPRSQCKGWFISSLQEHMRCEACELLR